MTAYYNEIDPYAAQWLRNLIDAGHIAPGIVDERSIEDVYPSDLRGFTQCHFFAGIGVWSHALRRAGWSDDRPVWTGSCPCQPFSAAGQGAGFDDERHLWPAFHHLIKECAPAIVLGEQVASKDADAWLDLVSADVEALGLVFGAVAFPSAGVGAPHIRERVYWVADTRRERGKSFRLHLGAAARGVEGQAWQRKRVWADAGPGIDAGWLADPELVAGGCEAPASDHRQSQADRSPNRAGGCGSTSGGMGHAQCQRPQGRSHTGGSEGVGEARPQTAGASADVGPGPTNGHWADVDWLLCRDGRWRPVEPGTFPLVDGAPARVGRLRAYGNAINASAACIFIECVMEQTQ